MTILHDVTDEKLIDFTVLTNRQTLSQVKKKARKILEPFYADIIDICLLPADKMLEDKFFQYKVVEKYRRFDSLLPEDLGEPKAGTRTAKSSPIITPQDIVFMNSSAGHKVCQNLLEKPENATIASKCVASVESVEKAHENFPYARLVATGFQGENPKEIENFVKQFRELYVGQIEIASKEILDSLLTFPKELLKHIQEEDETFELDDDTKPLLLMAMKSSEMQKSIYNSAQASQEKDNEESEKAEFDIIKYEDLVKSKTEYGISNFKW